MSDICFSDDSWSSDCTEEIHIDVNTDDVNTDDVNTHRKRRKKYKRRRSIFVFPQIVTDISSDQVSNEENENSPITTIAQTSFAKEEGKNCTHDTGESPEKRRKISATTTLSSPLKINAENFTFKEMIPVALAQTSNEKENKLNNSVADATLRSSNPLRRKQELTPECSQLPSVNEIENSLQDLFGHEKVKNVPCASAPIFAYICLVFDRHKLWNEAIADKVGISVSILTQSWFDHILPLIRAFVDTEYEASYHWDTKVKMGGKVHFCTFDCSSVWSPVDAAIGSHVHIERTITRMDKVFKQIDKICSRGELRSETCRALEYIIQEIVSHLGDLESPANQDTIDKLCKIVPASYFPSRIIDALKIYRYEFEDILFRLSEKNNDARVLSASPWREQLGELYSRMVRFNLRRMFNHVPCSYTKPSRNFRPPDLSRARSNIHQIVRFKNVADGCVSAVVNLALRRIFDLFKLNGTGIEIDSASYTTLFCARTASQKQFRQNEKTLSLTSDELDDILSDIGDMYITIAGAKAAEFLCKVLTWPGVEKAIVDIGGWDKVENFSLDYSTLGLKNPQNEHFFLLKDVKALRRKLSLDLDQMKESALVAEKNSTLLGKRFRCGTRKKSLLRKNSDLVKIRDTLKGIKSVKFPTLIPLNLGPIHFI